MTINFALINNFHSMIGSVYVQHSKNMVKMVVDEFQKQLSDEEM